MEKGGGRWEEAYVSDQQMLEYRRSVCLAWEFCVPRITFL